MDQHQALFVIVLDQHQTPFMSAIFAMTNGQEPLNFRDSISNTTG